MLRIKRLLVLGGIFSFTAVSGVSGAPGDVISSFPATIQADWPAGIYRDGSYVYFVVSWAPVPFDSAYKYTPTGSYVGSVRLGSTNVYPLNDPDHSRLGDGYMTVSNESDYLMTYELSTGSCVETIDINLYDLIGYAYRGDGARFAYVSDDTFMTYKLNPAWRVVDSFFWGGPLAATGRYDGLSGNYVILNSNPAYVYTGAGSLVGTFANRAGPGCTCGPGYPASWGTTLWNCRRVSGYNYVVYQIDLGNGPVAVAPASVGKIKALYR